MLTPPLKVTVIGKKILWQTKIVGDREMTRMSCSEKSLIGSKEASVGVEPLTDSQMHNYALLRFQYPYPAAAQ